MPGIGSILPAAGVTLAPGRARISPLMTIRSSASRPFADDAQAELVVDRTGPDDLGHDGAVGADGHDDLARLVGHDGAVGDQDGLVGLRAGDAHAAELAGRDQRVGIGEDGARPDRAGVAVDVIVDEVQLALERPVILVDQVGEDGNAGVARRGQRPAAEARW